MLRVRCELKKWTCRDRSRTTRGRAAGEGDTTSAETRLLDRFPPRQTSTRLRCTLQPCKILQDRPKGVKVQEYFALSGPTSRTQHGFQGRERRQARKEGSGQQTTGAPGSPRCGRRRTLLERGEGTFQGNRPTNGRTTEGAAAMTTKPTRNFGR